MFIRLIEGTGDKTIRFVISFYDALFFMFNAIIQLFNPKSYHQNTFSHLVVQTYHTSVSVIGYFILSASFFGSVAIGLIILLATQYNMQFQVGSIIVTFIINEFATLFSVLFISFRSNHLLKSKTLNFSDANLITPSILSGVINMLSLSILFSIIMIASAYIFTFFFMGMDFYTYKYLIYKSIELEDIIVLLSKSIVFGFLVMLIPIYSIQKIQRQEIPIKFLLIFLFFIEIIFLMLEELIHVL